MATTTPVFSVPAAVQSFEKAHWKAVRANCTFEKDISYVSKEIEKNQNRPSAFKQLDLQATQLHLSASWASYILDTEKLSDKIDTQIDADDRYNPQLNKIRFETLGLKASLQRKLTSNNKTVQLFEQCIDSLFPRLPRRKPKPHHTHVRFSSQIG